MWEETKIEKFRMEKEFPFVTWYFAWDHINFVKKCW